MNRFHEQIHRCCIEGYERSKMNDSNAQPNTFSATKMRTKEVAGKREAAKKALEVGA